MRPFGCHIDSSIRLIELFIGRVVTDRVLVADVFRDSLTDRHNLAHFLGHKRFTPAARAIFLRTPGLLSSSYWSNKPTV